MYENDIKATLALYSFLGGEGIIDKGSEVHYVLSLSLVLRYHKVVIVWRVHTYLDEV